MSHWAKNWLFANSWLTMSAQRHRAQETEQYLLQDFTKYAKLGLKAVSVYLC